MPGFIGAVTGFIERQKGKGYAESSCLQRFAKGGASMAGGGAAVPELSTPRRGSSNANGLCGGNSAGSLTDLSDLAKG